MVLVSQFISFLDVRVTSVTVGARVRLKVTSLTPTEKREKIEKNSFKKYLKMGNKW